MKKIVKGLKEIEDIQKGIVKLSFAATVVETILPFISIYMIARIVDFVSFSEYKMAIYAAMAGVLFMGVTELLKIVLDYNFKLSQQKFEMRYAIKLSGKFATLDYEKVEDVETHRLKSRIEEMRNLNNAGLPKLLWSFPRIINALFEIIFAIALTWNLFTINVHGVGAGAMYPFILSPFFSILMIIVILINAGISMKMGLTMTCKFSEIMNNIIPFNRVYNYYFEYMSTYRAGKDIRIFNQKDLIEKQIDTLMQDVNDVFNELSKNKTIYSTITKVFSVFVTVLIYIFIGLRALAGAFGVGSVVQYISALSRFTDGFTNFVTEVAQVFANNEALNVYFTYQSIPSKVENGGKEISQKMVSGEVPVDVEFRNVSFRYPGSDEYALKNINLSFGSEEKLAIVGMNGSGKTTFIKLLCRLYDPTEGSIFINGINIKEYDLEEYMRLFSVVFQDFELLSFTLKENIAVCQDAEMDEERIKECIKEVGLDNKEQILGLNTVLFRDFDENGIEISGGEAQKIALARALYRQGAMLILDEPTAALDPIAEAQLYENFSKIVKNKTAVFISHRLASCQFCDDIIVFNEGKLIQRGTHKELLGETEGKYYQLWSAQAQHYN